MTFPATPRRLRTLLWGALLCGLTAAAYGPALRGGFILDDDNFLTDNPLIRSADGLRRIWLTRQAVDYWPVTSTSLWFEWRLWGLHPAGYHATNLILHVVAALLLWRVLFRLGIPGAGLAALLFAIHPVNVESVAWITQRKNLLAMVFFLLSVLAFVAAEARAGGRGRLPLILSLAAFVLALLSKGSVVPLPLVLLGIVAWRRRVGARDLRRLAPFFAVAVLFAAVNVWFQNRGNLEAVRHAGPLVRGLAACAIPWFYLWKILLPWNLIFIYPQWQVDPRFWAWWLAPAATIGVTFWLLRHRRDAARPAAFAWGYFWAMLIPVLGLADIRFMRFSLVADHYAHLAAIGVFALAGAGWAKAAAGGRAAAAAARIGAATVAGTFALLTWRQCLPYRSAEALYAATLRRNPAAWMLHNNLGYELQKEGRTGDALAEYRQALRLRPDYAEAHNNLGALLSGMGRTEDAARECETAVRLVPEYADANANLAVLRARQGRTGEAIGLLDRALSEKPGFAKAHYNLAGIWESLGRRKDALLELEETVRLDPQFAAARNSLGGLLYVMGRPADAFAQVAEAVRLNPRSSDAHTNLGIILQSQGRLRDAREQFDLARRLKR